MITLRPTCVWVHVLNSFIVNPGGLSSGLDEAYDTGKKKYAGLSSGLGLMWKITSLFSLGIEGIADFYQSKTFTYAEGDAEHMNRGAIKMAPRDFQTFVHLRFTWP